MAENRDDPLILRTCVDPKGMNAAVKEIMAVIKRNETRGIRRRTDEERWNEALEWVRETYPDAELSDLAPGYPELSKFHSEILLERRCDECHGSTPWNCTKNHQAVLLNDNEHDGKHFDRAVIYVAYTSPINRCNAWREWNAKQAAARPVPSGDGRRPFNP